MKKIDKLRKQRYPVSMKIIELESKNKLTKKEEKELEILKAKESDLDRKIKDMSS